MSSPSRRAICFTEGHTPYCDAQGRYYCATCSTRLWSSSEVPPIVTLTQLLLLCGLAGVAYVWLGLGVR